MEILYSWLRSSFIWSRIRIIKHNRRYHRNKNLILFLIGFIAFNSFISIFPWYPAVSDLDESLLPANTTFSLEILKRIALQRIETLQNPDDCNRRGWVVCSLNIPTSLSSRLHFLGYCLSVAQQLNRVFTIDDRVWSYNGRRPGGWVQLFQPVSRTCNMIPYVMKRIYDFKMTNLFKMTKEVIFLYDEPLGPVEDLIFEMPADLEAKVSEYHSKPKIWYWGVLLSYLMRLNPKLRETFESNRDKMSSDYVGIHVRRTDHITLKMKSVPIKIYPLESYEKPASKWLSKVDHSNIYLASDSRAVYEEFNRNYSDEFHVYGKFKENKIQDSRIQYSIQSLKPLVIDILLLARSQYIVCALSSNACRTAYELQQAYHNFDATQRIHTLDSLYSIHENEFMNEGGGNYYPWYAK